MNLATLLLVLLLSCGMVDYVHGGFSLENPDGPSQQTTDSLQDLQQLIDQERNKSRLLQSQVTDLYTQLSNLNNTVDRLQTSLNNYIGLGSEGTLAYEGILGSPATNLANDEVLIFRETITDVGSPYDVKTGIFHCKVAGVYLFAATLMTDGSRHYGGIAEIHLKSGTSDKVIARPQTGAANGIVGTGEVGVVEARAGDEVKVLYTGPRTAYLTRYTRFTGLLLKHF